MFSERAISAVPIIDDDGVVVNLYETVDVIVRNENDAEVVSDSCSKRHLFGLEHTKHLT